MRLRNILVLFGLSAAMVSNVDYAAAQATADEHTAPRAISTSPVAIARVINQRSRIATDSDLSAIWTELGIEAGGFANCGGVCAAKIFRQQLDEKPEPEVVVKVNGPFEFRRYLIFTRGNRLWRFLGHVDHDFNKYEEARHRVERFNARNWLVIRGQEGSGSGFALYGETWYQISDGGVRPVLRYPAAGQTYPWPSGLGREFKVRRIATTSARGEAKNIVLQYTVTYVASHYSNDDSERLFVNSHQVRYAWDQNSRTFVFDSAGSNISEDEIEAIANIQAEDEPDSETKIGNTAFYSEAKAFAGAGYEVFLKYNSAALMKVATGRSAQPKEWLRHFLDECDDTPEKISLLNALNKKP